jgi:nucleotidyltransferase/DNA polymerase involved in DNA repair
MDAYTKRKAERIVKHLRKIMEIMDFDTSEFQTELFADVLAGSLRRVAKEVRQSNRNGLCYDTTVGLAYDLIEQ